MGQNQQKKDVQVAEQLNWSIKKAVFAAQAAVFQSVDEQVGECVMIYMESNNTDDIKQ